MQGNQSTYSFNIKYDILKQLGTPCLIHQSKYSMLVRTPEEGLLDVLGQNKVGCIAFSPLAQGLLTDKYLNGIPVYSLVPARWPMCSMPVMHSSIPILQQRSFLPLI
jgi:aryl-alcohol dehydrogenase-like predicted oxidoreductase